ncbi:MAG: DUF2892 domain-containing protein [Candidatus Aenigmarchaeota archaeon]|nr:DUF2892 domain-containing protein [Candidatus Aenigmarchaeota archaeon]
MKQNLGRLDRIFRFALAVWWLGPFAPNFAAAWANWIIVAVGWISLAESLLGYCWLHKWFGINNKNQ